jgi:hypothetical protein
MSSSFRSGHAARISAWVIPSAIMPTTVATGIRNPRTHGTPPLCLALTVIRVNTLGYLRSYDSLTIREGIAKT